jgi:hypothetical protein
MIEESRARAYDRGFRDAHLGKQSDSGYKIWDSRPVVSTRLLAYFTGYGEGLFASREHRLPTGDDKALIV